MSILRHELSTPYTNVPNALWADPRMTMSAKCVVGFLLGQVEYWDVRIKPLATFFGVGRDAMSAALRSAQEAGWIYRQRIPQADGTWTIETVVRDVPLDIVPPIDGQGCQKLTGSRESRRPVDPATASTGDITTTEQQLTNNQEKNSPASQPTPSLRRARRGRRWEPDSMPDAVDEVFARPGVSRRREQTGRGGRGNSGHDSAWGLNKYYRDAVFLAGAGRVGDTNDAAMRGFFAKAKKQGVAPETLRTMIDLFVNDPSLFDKSTARWTTFIRSARLLQNRADKQTPARGADIEADEIGGAIPQQVLQEILGQAGASA